MKEKIKLVIVFILGIMISVVISVYAATVISAGEVSFNGSTSNIKYNGTTAANVSDAINGVYDNANTLATNVTTLKNKLEDSNTLSSGYYTMPNGLTIVWGIKNISRDVKNTWGSIYASGEFNPNISFPKTFSTIYAVSIIPCHTNGSYWVGDYSYTLSGISKIQIYRGTASGTDPLQLKINYLVIGKL